MWSITQVSLKSAHVIINRNQATTHYSILYNEEKVHGHKLCEHDYSALSSTVGELEKPGSDLDESHDLISTCFFFLS
jgi:hypothetical protein